MKRVKWTVVGIAVVVLAAFLAYFMPSYDIVKVVGTEVARQSDAVHAQEQPTDGVTDMRFIQTVDADGRPIVYRNQDTGWGWPPYFKFDSADLAARADSLVSTDREERWSIVEHYGWRIEILGLFPNATDIRPATGPGERVIPWVNVVILMTLGLLAWALVRTVRRLTTRIAG
jgi:hypothetical protein